MLRDGGDWWEGLFANNGHPAGGRAVAEQCRRAVLAQLDGMNGLIR